MLSNIAKKAELVIDARSAGRFIGAEPEPRAGLRGGHIPGEAAHHDNNDFMNGLPFQDPAAYH